MEKFIEELNNFTENKYEFMLKSALLKRDADFCVLEILYKDGTILTAAEKKKIEKFLLEFLPKKYKYEFDYIKRYINADRVRDDSEEFITKEFPSISHKVQNVELNGNFFSIEIVVDELSFDRAVTKRIDQDLIKYLKTQYSNFEFDAKLTKDVVFIENKKEQQIKNYREEDIDIYANRKIEFFDIVELVGEKFENIKADYIKDKTMPEENVVVCGKISSIKEVVLKPRKKKKGKDETQDSEQTAKDCEENIENQLDEKQTEEDEKITYQRKMYKFVLSDFTGDMNCVFFSNKENQAKLEKLEVGSVIVVRGKFDDDKFSGGETLTVKDIAYCSIPENLQEYIEYRKEKPFYEFVEPEKIVTFVQGDLMNFASTKHIPKYLQDKTFICYDFETTGLHYAGGDRIIEIGAVKIENGKIIERFMSYVDPEKHIPEESSAISGIVDSDVAGAPKAGQVLQDFYKWTRNAIIIGYNNINFDNIFLVGQGKESRWNFDNETDDVYKWAQKYVRGAKNYKLKTIADKLGVVLDNAHRAVYDALATAEVFIKIQEMYENDINIEINKQ